MDRSKSVSRLALSTWVRAFQLEMFWLWPPHTAGDWGHGFHATKQGERYTLTEPARRTVLDRLLALNHQRYAEEVKAGLHDKGAKKGKGRKMAATLEYDLFK